MHLASRLLLTCFLAISVATAANASLGQTSGVNPKVHLRGQKFEIADWAVQIARNYLQLKEKSPPDTTSASGQLFAGEQFDPNLGWYYLRARYMDPSVGRFATKDIFLGVSSKPLTLHKYLYANSSPVLYTDPSGYLGLISLTGTRSLIGSSISIGSTKASITAAAKFSAELAFEYATGFPVLTSPKGFLSAVRSFRKQVGNLAEGVTKRLREGRIFENAVGQAWGLTKNKVCYKDGIPQVGSPRGCKIPDFFQTDGGRLVEVKNSMGAVKKKQFVEFLKISREHGMPMTFVFKLKPTAADLEKLQRWAVDELGSSEDILLNIVHVLD